MKKEVKTEEQKVDKLVLFEEMKDSMEQAVHNLSIVIEQQADLVKIVMENDKEKKFESFINELNGKLSDMANQREALKTRITTINSILLLAKNDEKFKCFLTDVLDVFGIFDK